MNTDLHLAEEGRPQRYRSSERGGPVLDAHRLKQDFLEKGMDPLEVGRRVVAGIRRNHLYILTHPEYGRGILQRCEALLALLPPESEPVRGARVRAKVVMLTNPIYRTERERRLADE